MKHNRDVQKKIKIVFCMQQVITGGIEKALLRLIEQLISTHPEYDISILSRTTVTEKVFLDFFRRHNIPVCMISRELRRPINRLIGKGKAYKRILNQKLRSADVIVDYFNCAFGSDLSHFKAPVIGCYHSSFKVFQQEFHPVCNIGDIYTTVVCLTDRFREDVLKIIPRPDMIVQSYNVFDIDGIRRMAEQSNRSTPPKCYNNQNGGRYFVSVMRLDKDKDYNTLINAFEIFAARHKDALLYIIGDGPQRDLYVDIVRKKGLDDKIIFVGTLDNPYGYMKNAVANILSSPSEGLSNVLIEAAILGTLNIASDCSDGPAEILMGGRGGLLFPVGDAAALAKQMADVWDNKADVAGMVAVASENLARFDAPTIAEKFSNIVHHAMRPRRRVGIMNFFFEDENYGAVLTAYALNRHLRELGYDARNINYTAEFYKARKVVPCADFKGFKDANLPKTYKINNARDLVKLNREFDAFITGSDQVFRHAFTQNEHGAYYLAFGDKNVKKIAYAASFGIDRFDGNASQAKTVKKLLSRMNAISVREADGVNILRDTFGLDGAHVLDPVFLIDWDDMTDDFRYDETVYYILNMGLRPVAGDKNMLNSPLGIKQWLSAIRNADLVVTDSFHGICFCLIFGTPFVALADRNGPVSRLYSLFDMFGLPREKILYGEMDMSADNMRRHIIRPKDSDFAKSLLRWRTLSDNFIKNSLGD